MIPGTKRSGALAEFHAVRRYNVLRRRFPMKLTGLLALLLFILLIFFAAPAASFAQAVAGPIVPAAKPDPSDLYNRALAEWARRGDFQLERDGVCYTMRTYVMARDDKDSDTTRMVRATRCLPGWKLEFKSAIDTVPRSEDGNPGQR